MKTFLNCLAVLSLLLTASCSKNDAYPDKDVRVLAKLDGKKVIEVVSKNALASFMSERLYKSLAVAKEKPFSLKNLSIESSRSYYYLFGTMTISDTKEPIAVAVELKKLKHTRRTAEASFAAFFVEFGADMPELGDDGNSIPPTHTCSGVNCNACAFIRDNAGRIIGCNCNSRGASYNDAGSSYCNHTVSGS